MKMRKSALIVGCLLIILSQYACKQNPVEPYPRDPRDYVWDATSLNYLFAAGTILKSIWGTDPRNIYVAGSNSFSGSLTVFHFNGIEWSPVTFPAGSKDVEAIYGFGANDIYVVGSHNYYSDISQPNRLLDSALILHYDGATWKEILRPHMGVRGLYSIWGSSPSNLYAGSWDGQILHFDGQSWSVQQLPAEILVQAIGGNQNIVFAVGNTFPNGSIDITHMFKNSGSGWTLVDKQFYVEQENSPRFGSLAIYSPSNDIVYSAGPRVFQWIGEKWVAKLDLSIELWAIGGSSENNMFAVGYDWVYHWNGVDWARLNVFPNGAPPYLRIRGIWTDGNEAFLAGFADDGSYVVHGK